MIYTQRKAVRILTAFPASVNLKEFRFWPKSENRCFSTYLLYVMFFIQRSASTGENTVWWGQSMQQVKFDIVGWKNKILKTSFCLLSQVIFLILKTYSLHGTLPSVKTGMWSLQTRHNMPYQKADKKHCIPVCSSFSQFLVHGQSVPSNLAVGCVSLNEVAQSDLSAMSETAAEPESWYINSLNQHQFVKT